MQFLAISRRRIESFSEADFAALAEEESQRVRTLYAEGVIRQIWRRGDMPGACILLEADSEEMARALLATLPLAKADMLELVCVAPLLPYPGFGPH